MNPQRTTPLPDNEEILAHRVALRSARFAEGPQVGDFLLMPDGTERRVAHDWGKDTGLQPTSGGPGGSFYLGDGYASFSGSLDPIVPHAGLVDTGRTKPGRFWFFSRNYARANNGIDVEAPCGVYRYDPGSSSEDTP